MMCYAPFQLDKDDIAVELDKGKMTNSPIVAVSPQASPHWLLVHECFNKFKTFMVKPQTAQHL